MSSVITITQNEKVVEAYRSKIDLEVLPLINGHLLNEEDLIIQNHIRELMCLDKTTLNIKLLDPDFLISVFSHLKSLEADGLIKVDGGDITVTTKGNLFIRNICAALDAKLFKKQIGQHTFSKAI